MMAKEEKLVHYILLAAEENGGTFPNMEGLTAAEQRFVENVILAARDETR